MTNKLQDLISIAEKRGIILSNESKDEIVEILIEDPTKDLTSIAKKYGIALSEESQEYIKDILRDNYREQ
ncbi:hypothetical protein CL617_05545 [archaeon]|nr:hypothetical protein [archaeon]|tara:strand:- start:8159 stop:8368 length:210 start_codon:yes stop_codon:yes gene_type:complete